MASSIARTDIRALYGGMDLGIGCFLIYTAWKQYVINGLMFGRIWGIVAEGVSDPVTTILLTIELAGTLAGNIALWRVKIQF